MAPSFDEMRAQFAAMQGRLDALERGRSGVSPENVQKFFVMHRHDGSAMGGQALYGPYFIRDEQNGRTYKIASKNGTLTLELVS